MTPLQRRWKWPSWAHSIHELKKNGSTKMGALFIQRLPFKSSPIGLGPFTRLSSASCLLLPSEPSCRLRLSRFQNPSRSDCCLISCASQGSFQMSTKGSPLVGVEAIAGHHPFGKLRAGPFGKAQGKPVRPRLRACFRGSTTGKRSSPPTRPDRHSFETRRTQRRMLFLDNREMPILQKPPGASARFQILGTEPLFVCRHLPDRQKIILSVL